MLKDDAKEMFDKCWALEKHLEEQKDTKGLKLLIEVVTSSSEVITTLVEYNNTMVQYCNEIKEVAKNGKQ